jgi:hypothetical protein
VVHVIKKLIIILLILCLPVISLGVTWTTDINTDGAGGACEDGGVCSQTEFENLSGDYGGSVFYVIETLASELDVNIGGTSLTDKVILDGWKGGTCDPPDTTCSSAANFSNAIELLTGNDFIVLRDFDFSDMSRAIKLPINETVTGFELRNCTFGTSTWTTLYLPVLEDFIIDNNRFIADSDAAAGQNIQIVAGKRGRITNNKTYGGKTSLILKPAGDIDGSGTQSGFEKIVIANNYFERPYEEGLSAPDMAPSSAVNTPFREYDTISSSTSTTVTLSDSDWGSDGGADPNYIGLYMTFLSGGLVGRYAQITDQNDEVFTLDTEGGLDFTDAGSSDGVYIGVIARKNYVGYNTTHNIRFGGSSLLLYGIAFETLVEGNSIVRPGNGAAIHIRTLEDEPAATGSVTGACGYGPTAANIIKDNTVTVTSPGTDDDAQIKLYLRSHITSSGCASLLTQDSYYNTVIDNILSGDDEAVILEDMHGYASGNVDGGDNPITPTLSNATNNIAYKAYWPYITGTPEVNGSILTLTMSENTNVSGYTTGDAWLEDGSENTIGLAYTSGDDTSTILMTAQAYVDPDTTWYFWFDGTDDSIQDASGNDMVVYGFKPVTVYGWYISAALPQGGGTSTSAALTWTEPVNTITVDVYIEEKSGSCDLQVGDKVKNDLDGETVSNADLLTHLGMSGALDGETDFCWRVDVTHAGGEVEGVVKEFSTSTETPPIPETSLGTLKRSASGGILKYSLAAAPLSEHYLLIDGAGHYLLIDGATNKLEIDGVR